MLRVIITISSQILFMLALHLMTTSLFDQSTITPLSIAATMFNLIILLFLRFSNSGLIPQQKAFHTSKSKIGLQSPKAGDRVVSFGKDSTRTNKRLLQSSLVIYKNKMNHSTDKDEVNREEMVALDTKPQISIPAVPNPNPVYVEQQICQKCNIIQPLRVKHCNKCERCIATYDHHSPIVNRCIGEKNKYLFMIHSIALIFWFVALMTECKVVPLPPHSNLEVIYLAFQCLILTGLVLICILFFYQLYLILTNQTTYENHNRERVPYLKLYDSHNPFSQGVANNIKQFFKYSFSKQLMQWELD